jgi:hypothetical protein
MRAKRVKREERKRAGEERKRRDAHRERNAMRGVRRVENCA